MYQKKLIEAGIKHEYINDISIYFSYNIWIFEEEGICVSNHTSGTTYNKINVKPFS